MMNFEKEGLGDRGHSRHHKSGQDPSRLRNDFLYLPPAGQASDRIENVIFLGERNILMSLEEDSIDSRSEVLSPEIPPSL